MNLDGTPSYSITCTDHHTICREKAVEDNDLFLKMISMIDPLYWHEYKDYIADTFTPNIVRVLPVEKLKALRKVAQALGNYKLRNDIDALSGTREEYSWVQSTTLPLERQILKDFKNAIMRQARGACDFARKHEMDKNIIDTVQFLEIELASCFRLCDL